MSSGNEPSASPPKADLPKRFDGKVVLITGANDRGIGGAIARRLCGEGATVSMFSLHRPDKLLRRLERGGAQHRWRAGDVRSSDDTRRAVEETIAEFGRIDVVINNAGLEFFSRLAETTDDDWQKLIDVNLTGVMKVSRAALASIKKPGGVIVNVASALALGGCDGFTAYSASKAALVGMTQSLAMELAPFEQRVVAVAPALVVSPMSLRYVRDASTDAYRRVEECHPLGIGLPEDVAAAVAFLASDEARWITGVTLPLGWSPGFALPADHFMNAPS